MFITAGKSLKTSKLLFGLSIVVLAFYLIGSIVGDIYRHAVVGVIYELLWLPMLGSLLVIPILSFVIIIKCNGKSKIYALLAIIQILVSIFIMTNH